MKKCCGILFDWDGTLVDSIEMKIRNAGIVFSDLFGWNIESVKGAYRYFSGIPRRDLFTAIAKKVGGSVVDDGQYQQLSNAFTSLNCAELNSSLVYPEVVATIKELRLRGLKLVISSSTPNEELQLAVKMVGLYDLFDNVWGSDAAFSKGPGHVQHFCIHYSMLRNSVCMIGDEESDFRLAREAACSFVARSGSKSVAHWQSLGVTNIIEKMPDLVTLVDAFNANNT